MNASHDDANAAQWWVQIKGKPYGPYDLAQMQRFMAEGRLRPASLVAHSPDGEWREARAAEGLAAQLRPRALSTSAAAQAKPAAETANVFVYAEIHSGGWTPFMAALESMGVVVDLAPGLWLVRTRHSAGVIRNTLSQTLERGDRFVVMDATRDRLAWFNLGPEVDVHIRDVWNQPPTGAKTR